MLHEVMSENRGPFRSARNYVTGASPRRVIHPNGTARQLMENLNAAGIDYGDIRAEAATMAGYVELARALSTQDTEVWQALPNQLIQHAIKGIITWARGEDRNAQLSPPGLLKFKAGAWTRLTPVELLTWAMTGTFTAEERETLSTAI